MTRSRLALLALAAGLGAWALAHRACARPVETGLTPLPPRSRVGEVPFQKGMVYGIFSRSGAEFHRRNLQAMRNLGVNSVQIVVPRSMDSVFSTTLSDADPMVTPSRESLAQAVREAHRLGMRVFLFPIIYVQDLEQEEWRGALQPLDWEVWWRSYSRFILQEARWAADHRVEIFSVGSELCSTEGQTERWRSLTRMVRQVYPGLVTYSANWDHLEPVGFAGEMDFIGMNAYFEVGDPSPSLEKMVARWKEILVKIETWQHSHGLPIVVTEIGYQSRTGSTLDPWDYLGAGGANPREQDLGYRAFMQAWSGREWLAGTYFYLWWDEDDGGRGYTPRGKPAARSLKQWYN
ncbi:MAG: hypothetical protein ACE5HD_05430 [Acidobacteriota bacterium]